MCGIAGWKLNESADAVMIAVLAHEMTTRGEDSYGFYNHDTGDITKGKDGILSGLRAREMQSNCGFLHTRHATTGDVTAENSHPFTIGNIIGAHNGVIYNHTDLNKKYSRKCAVDSMHIFEHLWAGLNLADVEGYGAIVFIRDGQMFAGRCNDGELAIAKTSAGVVFASTAYAVQSACDASGIKIEHFYKVEEKRLYLIESDCLYNTDMPFDLNPKKLDYGPQSWRDFRKSDYQTDAPMSKMEEDFRRAWHIDGPEDFADLTSQTSQTDFYITYNECEICGELSDLREVEDCQMCRYCAQSVLGIQIDRNEWYESDTLTTDRTGVTDGLFNIN